MEEQFATALPPQLPVQERAFLARFLLIHFLWTGRPLQGHYIFLTEFNASVVDLVPKPLLLRLRTPITPALIAFTLPLRLPLCSFSTDTIPDRFRLSILMALILLVLWQEPPPRHTTPQHSPVLGSRRVQPLCAAASHGSQLPGWRSSADRGQ